MHFYLLGAYRSWKQVKLQFYRVILVKYLKHLDSFNLNVGFLSQGRQIFKRAFPGVACVTKYDSIGKVPCRMFRGFTLQSEIPHGVNNIFFVWCTDLKSLKTRSLISFLSTAKRNKEKCN